MSIILKYDRHPYFKLGDDEYIMKKNDLILAIICIILGILVYMMGSTFPMQASDFPQTMAIALIILGGVLVGRYVRVLKNNPVKTKSETKKNDYNENLPKVGLIALLFIVYYLTLEKLGYIIPTFLLSFLTIYILKYKSIKTTLIVSSVLSVSLYLIFTFAFQVNLPRGIFY